MFSTLKAIILLSLLLTLATGTYAKLTDQKPNDLDALWNLYSDTYISDGRVISLDENHITTSEGQSYALLRAVWSDDRETFDTVLRWTQQQLSRPDRLFSWKWKDRILDKNAATDADTDIALALLLAAERFDLPHYKTQALQIIDSIWENEVLEINGRYYITGGNWAPDEAYPTIHVGYLAPYAYELFSRVDSRHPWEKLITTSYDILEWLYFDKKLALPPEKIYLDKNNGSYLPSKPELKRAPIFSYDVFPIFWRVATDEQWFGRGKSKLRKRMLRFFEDEWQKRNRFFDRYTLQGEPQSQFEALPLYATVSSLARINKSPIAQVLDEQKVHPLWSNALVNRDTPYYLHNWLWFDRALALKTARSFDEFPGFWHPFDVIVFNRYFAFVLLAICLVVVVLLITFLKRH